MTDRNIYILFCSSYIMKELSNGLICIGGERFPSKEAAEEVGYSLTIHESREDVSKIEEIAYDLNTGQMVLGFEEQETNRKNDVQSKYRHLSNDNLKKAYDVLNSEYIKEGFNDDSPKEMRQLMGCLRKVGAVSGYSNLRSKALKELYRKVDDEISIEYSRRLKEGKFR